MKIFNKTFRDDDGNIISEDEQKQLLKKFNDEVDARYEKIVNCLVEQINQKCSNNNQKLWLLFDYLTKENMQYNLMGVTPNGRMALDYGYEFPPYKSWKIQQNTKYPVILNHSGVCISYAKTFEDICNRLGIPCKVVTGFTGMEHAWNVVFNQGELRHIDIAYAIINKNKVDKSNYFLKTFAELKQICGNRSINESLEELRNELCGKIRIISRTDKKFKDSIKVINRNDGKEITTSNRIKIINRTDIPQNKSDRSKRNLIDKNKYYYYLLSNF